MKNKPNLIIILDALTDNKLNVFEQEINKAITIFNNSLEKKNTVVIYDGNYHTPYDTPGFNGEVSDFTFYDSVLDVLKEHTSVIKRSRTVINILMNTEEVLNPEQRGRLVKLISSLDASKLLINFQTTRADNFSKSLDFLVVGDVYSPTSAGIQIMVSAMVEKTLKFLKGKNYETSNARRSESSTKGSKAKRKKFSKPTTAC